MRVIFSCFCLITISFFSSYAQKTVVSGYIRDAASGEALLGATVYNSACNCATISNSFGYFSMHLSPTDSIALTISYIGYTSLTQVIIPDNQTLEFKLKKSITSIDEIVIKGTNTLASTNLGSVEISPEQIKSLPAFLGEADVLRSLQIMPGVSSGKEGTSGLYVRGGTPDQNLFLLDDVPLYYVNHIGGFVSTFDPDAIKSIKLYKGGFPANYHGRLSSIVDLRMKDGNMKETQGAYTIGLLSTKFFLETPVKKDTSSIMLSIRRCNIDIFTRLLSLIVTDFDGMAGYTFYDANLKFNRIINEKNRIYFSLYSGRDKLFVNAWDSSTDEFSDEKYSFTSKIRWGNFLASMRWNHLYSQKLFSNTTLYYTQFWYKNNNEIKIKSDGDKEKIEYLSLLSGVADICLKKELSYHYSESHLFQFGLSAVLHNYNPGQSNYAEVEQVDTLNLSEKLYVPEITFYAKDKFRVGRKLAFDYGFSTSILFNDGTNYSYIEPRFSSEFSLSPLLSAKLSYARMHQPVHLLSNSGTGLPTDLWVPSTATLKPEKSDQISFGVVKTFSKWKGMVLSIDAFYKKLDELIELKEGVSIFSRSGQWESKIETGGQGEVYGLELLLEKKAGSITGWIAYTYTHNERVFSNINEGISYPFHYNKLHDLAIVVNHKFNDRISFSSSWIYNTGFPVTLVQGKYFADCADDYNKQQEIHLYRGRNSSNMPDYHRLDLAIHFTKPVRKGLRTWSLSIYNVYNRQNPYFLFYKYKNQTREIGLFQYSLFPIIPFLSYSYKF